MHISTSLKPAWILTAVVPENRALISKMRGNTVVQTKLEVRRPIGAEGIGSFCHGLVQRGEWLGKMPCRCCRPEGPCA